MKKDHFLKLLSLRLAGEISGTDDAKLQRAIEENDEYQELSDKLTAYFQKAEGQGYRPGKLDSIWEMIGLAGQQNVEGRFNYSAPPAPIHRSWFLKTAAVFILVLGCGVLGYYLLRHAGAGNLNKLAAGNEAAFRVLDDGTRVWLNKRSSITYNRSFGKKERRIYLDGEAYFDVKKNKAVPLIVYAGAIEIEVKGTVFNVHAYKEDEAVEVSLIRGSIQVTDNKEAGNNILLKPNEKLVFVPHARSGADKGFRVTGISTALLSEQTKWISDTLVFRKERLKDLIIRMEKKYAVKIEIRSERIGEKRFSGTFTSETIQQALEALKLSYPLSYTINNKMVIIKD